MKVDAQAIVPAALVGFVVYRRIRRSIGFQKFSPGRLKFGIALFTLLGGMLLVQSGLRSLPLAASLAGAAIGAALAFYAVRHVVHELRDDGLFVKTHIIIESSVLLLFLGRLGYRIMQVTSAGRGGMPAGGDPATLLLLFIVVAYYWGYNGWLLRNGQRLAAGRTEPSGR
jgi:hypothetical protein